MAQLKEKLTTPPVFAFLKREGRIVIATVACNNEVRSALQQKHKGQTLTPIEYCSQTLDFAERLYDTTHWERLPVVQAVLLLWAYIEGSRFTIKTNHRALPWILDLKECSGRLAMWRRQLLEFEFENIHRAGIVHQAVGALSRLPTTSACEESINDDMPVHCIVNFENYPFLADPDADPNFELKENELFGILPAPEDVELPSEA